MKKRVIVTHFTTKILCTYLYITCNKKILFVKKYFSLLWVFSDFSILYFFFPEHKHYDNAATNSNSENARSIMVASCGEASVRWQRKMSQTMGTFGLLDFTMLRPVLAWRAFWNLWTVYFFNFPIFFFSGRGQPRVTETSDTESADIRRSTCTVLLNSCFQRQRSTLLQCRIRW